MSSSSSIISTLGVTFCISSNHNIYIFGYNESFENNDKLHIPELIKGLCDIKMIDCGSEHILCLDFDGRAFSFGKNYEGQLGLGRSPSELKVTYIPQKVDIPPCKQIACGNHFSMCLGENNLLYSFGNNINGQLGLDNDNDDYNSPQLIPNLYNIEYISCGGYHSICKAYDNTYYGWGSNDSGQLSHDEYMSYNKPTLCNNYPDNIISIKCGTNHTLLLALEGNIYSFGNNRSGQLGLNDNDIGETNTPILIRSIPEIRRIECGDDYSMCIDVNDHLWLFGENLYGQLGLGDEEDRYKPIKHPTLSNIIDISSGGSGTFVKTSNSKIYAFGSNHHRQLGIKVNVNHQVTPIQVFQGNEDIWGSFIGKSKQKSARK